MRINFLKRVGVKAYLFWFYALLCKVKSPSASLEGGMIEVDTCWWF
jgi:hypothetical protein